MENKLPKGWVETEFTNLVANVIGGDWGKDPDFEDSDFVEVYCIRGSEIKNWNNNFGDTAVVRKIKKSSLASRCLINGDILLEISGGGPDQPVGRVVLVTKNTFDRLSERPIVCTNFLRLVRPVNHINSNYFCSYLEYFYHSGEVVKYQGGSNNLRNLKYKEYETIGIPLPPLAEQERIVAKLDKLFAQHEKIKKALDRIPQLLKAFRQQVLTQAVTGKLTEQWREGKGLEVKFELENSSFRAWKFSIPSRWRVAAYGDVADVKSNLVDPNSFSDYFLIAPDNIEVNTGRLINRPLVSEINPKSGKHLFDKGVIIYSKIRPYLNKLIIADFIGLCSADMYPIDKTVYTETKFIFYYMLSNEFLSYSTTAGERSVLPKINQKGLKEIPFPLPPLQEQQEIVRRVECLFAKADAIEARYQILKAKIDNLPQAILHKAFKGELVPQLPTDGDAKDLLAEIMALKNGVNGKKKKTT